MSYPRNWHAKVRRSQELSCHLSQLYYSFGIRIIIRVFFANLFFLVDHFVDPKYMKPNIRFVEVQDLNRIL